MDPLLAKLKPFRLQLLAGLLLLPYLWAWIWPDPWWAAHFSVFLPNPWGYVSVLLPAIIIFISLKLKQAETVFFPDSFTFQLKNLHIIGIGLLAGIIFYAFPIEGNYYGNSRAYIPLLDQKVLNLSEEFWHKLFSFKFVPGNGREGVLLVVTYIAYAFELTYREAFRCLGAICGAGFVITWLLAVRAHIQIIAWQCLLMIIGILSPVLLIFFGHIESYALVYWVLLIWLIVLLQQLKTRNKRLLWVLIPLLVIGIRFHTLMYLLVPAWLLAFVRQFHNDHAFTQAVLTVKGMLTKVFLPIGLMGLLLYFFVYKDFNDPRVLKDFTDIERLFLPLISPDAPLDKYNLLSLNHIWDYVNAVALWSVAAIFLLLGIFMTNREKLRNDQAISSILLLVLLLFMAVLFMINPLFSIPMDWDLFSFPAPIILVFLLYIGSQVQEEPLSFNLYGISLGLALLSLPIFVVNSSKNLQSYRLESVGKHVYKTYYEHASTYLLFALQLIEDHDLYAQRKSQLLSELQSYALPGKDEKYAELLIDNGISTIIIEEDYVGARKDFVKAIYYYPNLKDYDKYLVEVNKLLFEQGYQISEDDKKLAAQLRTNSVIALRKEKDFRLAIQLAKHAELVEPNSPENILLSMEAYFRLNQFTDAYNASLKLLAFQYPDLKNALRMSIHCALEAGLYPQALTHTISYLSDGIEDPEIRLVQNRLRANDRVEELKLLFNRGN